MLKPSEAQKRDSRPLNGFVRMANQPSCVKGGVSFNQYVLLKRTDSPGGIALRSN